MSESLPQERAEPPVTIDDDDDDLPADINQDDVPKVGEPSPNYDIQDSVVYSHNWFTKMEVDGESCAACRVCEQEKKSGKSLPKTKKKKKEILKTPLGTTKPLFSHMKSHHKEEYKVLNRQYEEIEALRLQKRKRKCSGDGDGNFKQLKLIGANNNLGLNNKLDPLVQARWDDAVVKFVSETGNSFRSCEKFDILLKAIWPSGRARVNVRTGVTVSKHVRERSQKLKIEVFSILNMSKDETRGISFTSDMWRSRALDSFMSLTAHFISKDFKLIKLTPFITWFGHNRHTGVNIKLLLDQFIKALGLEGQGIHRTVVTDNASNNGVMFRLSRDSIDEYKCGIHTMALAVKDVWELDILNIKISEVLKMCKELAKFVRRSEHNKNELKKECSIKEIRFIMPVLPNETRWHSVEMNVRSVLHLAPAIQSLAQKDTSLQWNELAPNAAELKMLKSMVEILTRIKVACKIWERDSVPTIQTVIPELFDIHDVLDKKKRNRERYVSVLARELKKLVEERFPESGTTSLLNCIAHLLDPEYKGLVLKQFNAYEKARQEIIRRGKKYEDVPPAAPADESNDSENEDENQNLSAAQRLKQREMAQMNRQTSASRNDGISATEVELQRYEQLQVGSDTELLKFWKSNEPVLPILAKIAREVFSIPVSSASSEREFSIGTLVCSAQRSSLSPEKVSDLMLLKSNSEVVSNYKNARGPIEAKYSSEAIKDLISLEFEQMENFEELTRRAAAMEDEDYDYVEDMVEREDEGEEGIDAVTIHDVQDMI